MIDQNFIEKQKVRIQERVNLLNEMIAGSSIVDDIGSADEDNASEFEQLEKQQAVAEEMKRELEHLQKALGQIEDGSYGVCRICSNPIEKGRLEAYPEADLCATHAQEQVN